MKRMREIIHNGFRVSHACPRKAGCEICDNAARELQDLLRSSKAAEFGQMVDSVAIQREAEPGPDGAALLDAIREHWSQKAEDRCWEDDLRLYAAAGLPLNAHQCVGDGYKMLQNCIRFIDKRCSEDTAWASYAELEAEIVRLKAEIARLKGEATP